MMAFRQKSPTVKLATAVTVLSVLVTASYGRRVIVGTRTDMGDVRRNKQVQELGRFSVDEYNDAVVLAGNSIITIGGGGGEKVEFMKVVEAQKQVVAGTKYYMKVWAVQNGRYREFDSVVEVKPWLGNSKKLLSFAPSQSKIEKDLLSGEAQVNKNFISSV